MTTTSSGSLGSGAASTGGASAGSSGAADSGAYGGCGQGQTCDGDLQCVIESDLDGDGYYLCEPTCDADADCDNPATTCHVIDAGPATCGLNNCPSDAVAGAGCDAGNAAPLGGTCIPEAFLCVRNGAAASCGDGGTSDNPWVYQVPDQTSDPSQLCPRGDACYNPYRAAVGGTCQKLCPFPLDGGSASCDAPDVCIIQDLRVQTWGFCLPCVSSGSDGGNAGLCSTNTDCCEGNCDEFSGLGTCQPVGT